MPEAPGTVIVVTLRITPGKERWSSMAVQTIADDIKSFAKGWCEVNNREADIKGIWEIYEGAD